MACRSVFTELGGVDGRVDVALFGLIFLELGGVGSREFKNVCRLIFAESGVTGRSAEFVKVRFKVSFSQNREALVAMQSSQSKVFDFNGNSREFDC